MCCHEHIYAIPQTWGLVAFILNILSPGLGTMVQSYYAKDGCSCSTWMVGFAQGLLAIIVVGWVWSIWHGYEVMLVSDKAALAGGQQVIVVNGGMQQQAIMVQNPNMMMQQQIIVQDPNMMQQPMMQQQPIMVQDPNMMEQKVVDEDIVEAVVDQNK